ncbi:MAG: hypothetical protein KDL31_00185 [Kiritimatiellae bacterium]|nr:hypothetical protein [Kiritimatiellia bacterium]
MIDLDAPGMVYGMHWKRLFRLLGLTFVLAIAVSSIAAIRGYRLYDTANDAAGQVRYLIENGESVGTVPATAAFNPIFLQSMFGADPELNQQLSEALATAQREDPSLRQGEISAMMVTYRKNGNGDNADSGQAQDVAVHIFGDLPLGRRQISMARNGFFNVQIDRGLWDMGNSILSVLGRDLFIVSTDDEIERRQQDILEAILTGDILPLVDLISDAPLHYMIVFPNPRDMVPTKLRNHVQAVVAKGVLSSESAEHEITVLARNEKSASLVSSILYDFRTAAILALRSRFRGVVEDTPWGRQVPVWWANEMAGTLEQVSLTREDNVVSLKLSYQRTMVNATLKSIERFGRDYTRTRGVNEEKLDPRYVDAQYLKSRSPNHYWSTRHKWGPDWPFGAPTNALEQQLEVPQEQLPPVTQPL